jgi:hypothetical protein
MANDKKNEIENPAQSGREPERRSDSARRGNLTLYGVAAGLSAAVPLPAVDNWLGSLARGSTMRRVAMRYGVTLTPEAREILAAPGVASTVRNAGPARFVRGILNISVKPARLLGGFEDGMAALLGAAFLDYYLRTADRPADAPLGIVEAERIRSAMSYAVENGFVSLAEAAPRGVGKLLQQAGRSLERNGADGRRAPERLVDAVLDSLADMPEDVMEGFLERFQEALDRETGNR